MSDSISERVASCFSAVFPSAPQGSLASLRQENYADWDSVTHVTLLASLSEEFGVELDFEEFLEVDSYEAAERLIRKTVHQ